MKNALTVEEFAEAYSLNPATVRTNVTRKPDSLPKVLRIGRSVRFLRTEIEKWEKNLLDAA
ncbi:helix-turn-helix domain-containing protein [Vibrio fluvialis]|uniref:Helix-turn-helix domain-containing protein n=2 Tax=Vibrio TaxID=662 RepID=A0A6G7CF96_9VIBR|nr:MULTISPECIES: helix-turn-helix domain-containing protein [Vibrio]ELM6623206.1 helix-turn-helix domain-containing protein [Vibrio fluvialis]EGQ8549559.1 helix-turn-helix domain-containing protein [Vibrio parahaemolyticus]EGQ9074337.1 helix-turn-helix domain-containing protein [Vibrio parahaemolyticus]EGQ9131127.1 helix-turn-helix domain-containing protein [Vibrio parahaemolyticus]EGR4362835.1 helix-turn-helix domain-containing protein [Vibrio cholerae]